MHATFLADTGRTAGGLLLVAPIALAIGRAARPRGDRVLEAGAGLAGAICVLVMCGVVLSAFTAVSTAGWLIAVGVLDLIVVSAWAVRWWRRQGERPAQTRGAGDIRWPRPPRPLPLLFALSALGMVVAAVAFSSASARRQERQSRFTQLWMVSRPRFGGPSAELGVANLEGHSMNYSLVVARGAQVLYSTGVRLAASTSWTTDVTIPVTSGRKLVSAALYRAGDTTPYRVTNLWTPSS